MITFLLFSVNWGDGLGRGFGPRVGCGLLVAVSVLSFCFCLPRIICWSFKSFSFNRRKSSSASSDDAAQAWNSQYWVYMSLNCIQKLVHLPWKNTKSRFFFFSNPLYRLKYGTLYLEVAGEEGRHGQWSPPLSFSDGTLALCPVPIPGGNWSIQPSAVLWCRREFVYKFCRTNFKLTILPSDMNRRENTTLSWSSWTQSILVMSF